MWPFESYHTVLLQNLKSSYDYVIVGGGTAGCVLANRLSEDPNVSVLLIERGQPSFSWASRIPLLSSDFQADSERSIKFPSVPQEHVGNRSMEIVTGNALGGTSRINGMVYTRGIPAQFNAWAAQGRKGWSYHDLFPYFFKSERALDEMASNSVHNVAGEWSNRSHPKHFFTTANIAVRAAEKLGFPYIRDLNSQDYPLYGIGKLHYTIDEKGRRCDAATAFLSPGLVQARKENLHLVVNALVTRLSTSIEDGNKIVEGVHIKCASKSGDVSVNILANFELILCAGTLGTPKILMLSGIGPADHLSQLGIGVQKDLPGVGSNLQDHIGIPILFNVPLQDSIMTMQKRPTTAIRELLKYVIAGRGMLLCPVHELSLFAKSDKLSQDSKNEAQPAVDKTDPANIPDIELMTIAHGREAEGQKLDGGYSLWTIPVNPVSRGTLRLDSKDPQVPPLCNMNLLADSKDRNIAHIGMRLCLELKKQMVEDGYPISDYVVPTGTTAVDLDKYIEEWGQSIYHYTSSCRMAPENDVLPGVVDDSLRVHGFQNLRIADASIFPSIIATHLQGATVAVAEKCADMLKEARGKK